MKAPPNILKRIVAIAAAITIAGSLAISVAAADDPLAQYENWDTKYKEYTYSLCEENNIDYCIVIAIIYHESRFQADSTHLNNNGTTDWGLMQINDVCFDYLNKNCNLESMEDLLDPYTAIRCGVALLKYHKDYTQDDSLALLRYQVGEGAYKRMTRLGVTTSDTCDAVLEIAKTYKIDNISSELMI